MTDFPAQQDFSATPSGSFQVPSAINDDAHNSSPLSPNEISESEVSGSTPDPESDDNMLENEHEVGLYTDATDDDAPELNIAEQIEKAEQAHRES